MAVFTHAIALVLGLGGGYWLHYKFGAALSSDAQKIKQMKL